MIDYYRVPQKKGISKDDVLLIHQEYQLKDAIHNRKIIKAKKIIMKNSNVNDQTISYLWTVNQAFICHSIDISENFSFITDKAIDHLCQCININNLLHLNLSDNNITDQGIKTLSNCSNMIQLESLIVYGNSQITSQSLIRISLSKFIKKLKLLDVHACSICDIGMSSLLKSQNASCLTQLNISMNWKRITDKSLISIGESKTCSNLQIINAQDCSITSLSVENMADSQNCAKLHTLIFNNSIKQNNNTIDDQALGFISYAKCMTRLKHLQIRNTQVTSKGIRVLAASLSAEFLQTLRLSYCTNIDDQVIICLKTLMEYQSFKKVYLNNTSVSKQACQKLEQAYPQINIIF